MIRTLSRTLLILVSLILIFVIVLAGFGYYSVRRSFPEIEGEIQRAGLNRPVEIYRDAFGIPHIYATNYHDLFFAQGYVHAQDRFWQMDFWRHIGSGRLSEMFGESQVETDRFLRTLGWARVVEEELATLDAETSVILEDYAAGVNAYLDDHQDSELSLEYAILKLLNPDYQPDSWTPLHSLTWAKAMAWDLGGNMDDEIQRAILLKTLTPQQVDEIVPPYPADHPVIVPNFQVKAQVRPAKLEAVRSIDVQIAFEDLARKLNTLETLMGQRGSGIGSNSWVLSGELTSTGMPLLANDPHLGAQMPSIWYEVGLHCEPMGPDCPYEITGFSFAGIPGVIIGHNDRIAWGFTNVGPDVQDLYIERTNPSNPYQYEVNGEWVDMELVRETIQVAGAEPVEVIIRYTRHGPIISDTYGLLTDFTEKSGTELPSNYVIALRWTALEKSETFPAIWKLNVAQNWDDFREALSHFNVPSQNVVYADVEGNIGYQTPGKIPIRANSDGTLPVPGWTDDYEWMGYIPYEELPSVFNPAEGYIVTANNAVVDLEYPYLIASTWSYGYRAQRIVDMIQDAPGLIDMTYIQKMQGDDMDLNAETLVPVLLELPLEDERLDAPLSFLKDWDYQAHMDSAPAALFEVFWSRLLAVTFQDDLPSEYWPEGGSRWFEVIQSLVEQPDSPWWDDQRTLDKVENRDDIFLQAFVSAVDELEKFQGKDPARWSWGDLHTVTFRNATLGESGIAPIEMLFNRGPYRTSGGESIVNATGWNATESYQVDWLPSHRMIVDLGNLENSLSIHTTGQSGHAYHPHYIDMADLWRNIQYHPMLWESDQIKSQAEGFLQLMP